MRIQTLPHRSRLTLAAPAAMGNAGHEANMELARIVPGVDVLVAAPTLVAGAEFPQMVSGQWSVVSRQWAEGRES